MFACLVGYLVCFILGAVLIVAVEIYLYWNYAQPSEPHQPTNVKPKLPESLQRGLNSDGSCRNDKGKEEANFVLNLFMFFLYSQLKSSAQFQELVQRQVKKEILLIMQSKAGRILKDIRIESIETGGSLPVIHNLQLIDAKLDSNNSHMNRLRFRFQLAYTGGFELCLQAQLRWKSKLANLRVRVNKCNGHLMAQFSTKPHLHWLLTFERSPMMDLDIKIDVEGRSIPKITNLLQNHILKKIRTQHTYPFYKMRYEPFFPRPPNYDQLVRIRKLEPDTVDALNEKPSPTIEQDIAPDFSRQRSVSAENLVLLDELNDDSAEKTGQTDRVSASSELCCSVELSNIRLLSDMEKRSSTLPFGQLVLRASVDPVNMAEMVLSARSAWSEHVLQVSTGESKRMGITCRFDYILPLCQSAVIVAIVEPNSLAQQCGIKVNDIVAEVGETPVISVKQCNSLLRQKSEFSITVRRLNQERLEELELELISSAGSGRFPHDRDPCGTNGSSMRLHHSRLHYDSSKIVLDSKASLFIGSHQWCRVRSPMFSCAGDSSSSSSSFAVNEPGPRKRHMNEYLLFSTIEPEAHLNLSLWLCQRSSSTAGTTGSGSSTDDDLCQVSMIGYCSISGRALLDSHADRPLNARLSPARLLDYIGKQTVGFDFILKEETLMAELRVHRRLQPPSGAVGCSSIRHPLLDFEVDPSVSASSPADKEKQHCFILTHINGAQSCCFCSKKIWFRWAMQCKKCALICHKRCANPFRDSTRCASIGDDDLLPITEELLQSVVATNSDGDSATSTQPQKWYSTVKDRVKDRLRRHEPNESANNSDVDSSSPVQTSSDKTAMATTSPVSMGAVSNIRNRLRDRWSQRRQARQLADSPGDGTLRTGSSRIRFSELAAAAAVGSQPLNQNQTLSMSPSGSTKSLDSLQSWSSADELVRVSDLEPADAAIVRRLVESCAVVDWSSWRNDDTVVTAAKERGQQLYDDLPLMARHDKFVELIGKLQAAIDRESQIKLDVMVDSSSGRDTHGAVKARPDVGDNWSERQSSLSRCEDRIQVLAFLMLHFCSGLQACSQLTNERLLPADSSPAPSPHSSSAPSSSSAEAAEGQEPLASLTDDSNQLGCGSAAVTWS